jgi:hypothetical protein
LLAARDINYVGFVEGDDIFSDKVDVVVTDGFTGNVALKAMEGAARLIADALREEFSRTTLRKLGYLAARPALQALRTRIDPRRYNGASMIGLNGIVIKSHGGADLYGFQRAIEVAVLEARNGVPARIVVANKADLPPAWDVADVVAGALEISAKTGAGLEALRKALLGATMSSEPARDAPALTNLRHADLLDRARVAIERAREAASLSTPEEFVLADLHEARNRLEEVTGARTSDDVLNAIFAKFCIGK